MMKYQARLEITIHNMKNFTPYVFVLMMVGHNASLCNAFVYYNIYITINMHWMSCITIRKPSGWIPLPNKTANNNNKH